MSGFRENELFEFDFDPGKTEAADGRTGEIRGEAFQQFAGSSMGLSPKQVAEGMVIHGFVQIVPGGRPGKGRHGKNSSAEDGLGFSALRVRYAEVAAELQIDKGQGGRHGGRLR